MADALGLRIGQYLDFVPGTLSTTFAIDASNKSLEYAFPSEVAAPITRLWVPPATLTGAQPTYRISLQRQAGDGFADGTTLSSGNASGIFVPTANAQWVNLGASYTPTRGELLSIVLSYASGTIGASNFAAFVRTFGGASNPHVLYTSQNIGGTRSKFGGSPITFGYGTATQAFGAPINNSTAFNFNNANEVGGRFTIPAGWGQSVQILGVVAFMSQQPGALFNLNFYAGGETTDTTSSASIQHDGDWGVTGVERNWTFLFANPITVAAGSTFRVGIGSNVATNTPIRTIETIDAADMAAFPLGTGFTFSSRSGGDWTDNTSRRPCMQLILSDIEPGAGGGGASRVIGSRIIRGAY